MPQPPTDPEFYEHQFDHLDLAKRVYETATTLNEFAEAQHEEERKAVCRNVDAPLECMSRP